jgi:hypothetical protein
MHKTKLLTFARALFACSGLVAADLRAAELEGALQYPPRSIGEDAQPPPPARMLPQPISPWRVELGVTGSSMPPSTQRFYIHSRSAGRDPKPRRGPETAVRGSASGITAAAECRSASGRLPPRPIEDDLDAASDQLT